ncbi:hypothetical protein [Lacinutrix sp. Hel_I_90]|uniref:hypothetical protein n=1 Tax=Lacinutrix sp. Hel_I_90 TaxID=1249999 RepID=UPI0005CAB10C|nr:hypothetical protein [Lacinutrix sp. Hel_I_90]
MLLLSDLRAFVDNYITTRPNLEPEVIVVASDDEASKMYKEHVNANDSCTLITVIPSHDSDSNDEDTAAFKNNLSFIIVKKTDATGGNDLKLDNYQLCQLEMLALSLKIKALINQFGEDCVFKDLDINSIQITPVNNYFSGNGYIMDVTNKTDF